MTNDEPIHPGLSPPDRLPRRLGEPHPFPSQLTLSAKVGSIRTMKTVSKHELTTEIDSLLADLRSSHEMVFITENGNPVAKLVPLDDEHDDGLLEDDDPFFTLLDELRNPAPHPVMSPSAFALIGQHH